MNRECSTQTSRRAAFLRAGVSLAVLGALAMAVFLWPDQPIGNAHMISAPIEPGSKGAFFGPVDYCSPDAIPDVGFIALLSPTSGNPVQIAGMTVRPFLTRLDRTTPTPGFERMVTLLGPAGSFISDSRVPDLALKIANQIRATGLVAKVGVIEARSQDRSLCSFNIDLTDSPAAAALATAAGRAMMAGGFASTEDLSSAGRAWNVTDDPLDPALVIVTLLAPDGPDLSRTPPPGPPGEPPPMIMKTKAIRALVNRSDKSVVAVGFSPWP